MSRTMGITWSVNTPTTMTVGSNTSVILPIDPYDPRLWCKQHGVKVTRAGYAYLYKAVNGGWLSGHRFAYRPGTTVTAPDWVDDHQCGGGLHFTTTPVDASSYYHPTRVRFLAVKVKVDDLRPIPGLDYLDPPKCKAPKCRVLYEVDIDGNKIENGEGV